MKVRVVLPTLLILVFVASSGGALDGKVSFEGSTCPAAHFTIQFNPQKTSTQAVIVTATAEDGTFHVDLVPGLYYVQIFANTAQPVYGQVEQIESDMPKEFILKTTGTSSRKDCASVPQNSRGNVDSTQAQLTRPDLPKLVRNFERVNDHLYSGGDISPTGYQELARLHIVKIVDLRINASDVKLERERATTAGIGYENVPLHSSQVPTEKQIQGILSILSNPGAGIILVHDRKGTDRIAAVIACYRIQHDGWSNQSALQEAERSGLKYPGLKAFLLQFRPMSLSKAPGI